MNSQVSELNKTSQEQKTNRIHLDMLEFRKLKDEQIKRIEFRDHMVHLHLLAVGGVAAWTMTHGVYQSLLLIPWVCFILGWTYLINDDRISAIGRYIRRELAGRLRDLVEGPPEVPIFGWEIAHRIDEQRLVRKSWQFAVDQIAFVLSGFLALGAFVGYEWYKGELETLRPLKIGVVVAESLMLVVLGILFYRFSEFRGDV